MDDSSRSSISASATVNTTTTTTTSCSYDDKVPLVLDGGSMFFKAGFADEEEPCAVFPTAVVSHFPERFHRMYSVGGEKLNPDYTNYPIECGVITNWDNMKKVHMT